MSPDEPTPPVAKHAPARFSTYSEVHESRMSGFRASGFVGEDDLSFDFTGSGVLVIAGEISCLGNIVIRVEKHLEVLQEDSPDPLVQTFDYAYNASVRDAHNFLRHDNLHPQEGHKDEYHKHHFDWQTGEERDYSPLWVGAGGWPTLSEFIGEVMDWYYRNRDDLPKRDAYGEIGLRG